MWHKILDRMISSFAKKGHLTVHYPNGTTRAYGDGTAPALTMTLTDTATLRAIILRPELGLGEAYMDARLQLAHDDLDAFLRFLTLNADAAASLWWRKLALGLRKLMRGIEQRAPARLSRRNIAHHYDLSAELYELFLDADRQYSCAYFTEPDMSLEAAQAAKKAHIAGKLLIEPGMEVLDIGCGWGGLGLTLARDYGARVTGVTLSQEQHRIATARAEAAGLSDRVRFLLQDYRAVEQQFDRIVSVGMFEHVGLPHYDEYFAQIQRLLAPEGVAMVHTIGRAGPPSSTSPWITKYIFPGGYVPSLSEMIAAVERSGLVTTDTEIWRLHYAETLRLWHDRFVAREAEARALYDDRFCRMWRYYLKASEHSFRARNQVVFQVQLTKDQAAVPLTRDYLYPTRAPLLEAAE